MPPQLQALHREVEATRSEAALVKANTVATAGAAGAGGAGAERGPDGVADDARLAELETLLEGVSKELETTGDK